MEQNSKVRSENLAQEKEVGRFPLRITHRKQMAQPNLHVMQ
jgi:hypothetical protein